MLLNFIFGSIHSCSIFFPPSEQTIDFNIPIKIYWCSILCTYCSVLNKTNTPLTATREHLSLYPGHSHTNRCWQHWSFGPSHGGVDNISRILNNPWPGSHCYRQKVCETVLDFYCDCWIHRSRCSYSYIIPILG